MSKRKVWPCLQEVDLTNSHLHVCRVRMCNACHDLCRRIDPLPAMARIRVSFNMVNMALWALCLRGEQ